MNQYQVKIIFTEPILGTIAKDKEIYTTFVQAKAIKEANKYGIELTDQQIQQEVETVVEIEEKGWTGFHQLEGQPILYDYVIKGFLKEACGNLRRISESRSSKLTAYRKVIDGLVFIDPRQIKLNLPEGEKLGVLERPLRAQTAQGERVTLARSDTCPPNTIMVFTIKVLGVVTQNLLKDWLDYGSLKGLGQWRNGGYGRFVYEIQEIS